MKIDFELQLHILETLAPLYPYDTVVEDSFPRQREDERFKANCIYLKEHGLLELPMSSINSQFVDIPILKITTRGLDFLTPSGGLSSLLNTVTIKFDAEQLRSILLAHIESNEPDPAKKSRTREIINGLTVEAIKALFLNLGAKGLAHLPDVYQLLQTHAHSVGSILA